MLDYVWGLSLLSVKVSKEWWQYFHVSFQYLLNLIELLLYRQFLDSTKLFDLASDWCVAVIGSWMQFR